MKWSVRDITGERKRGHITKKLRSEFKDFWVLENPLRLFFKVWKSFHRKLARGYVCVCVYTAATQAATMTMPVP